MDKELHAGRILRMPEVCQYTGIRRSSVYRKLAEGSFPPQSGWVAALSAGDCLI